MLNRVLLVAVAASALLVAPIAITDAKKPEGVGGGKPEGVGGGKPEGVGSAKKCEKPRRVGFKINGTLPLDAYAAPLLTVDVTRANRHARDWLDAGNEPIFDTLDAENVKFIGVTDTGVDGVCFEDAAFGDSVKLKAKLELPKHGCEGEPEPVNDTALQVSDELDITKIKVKRADNGTDETETVETD